MAGINNRVIAIGGGDGSTRSGEFFFKDTVYISSSFFFHLYSSNSKMHLKSAFH